MIAAYLVLLCEFFWEFSIFHFCRPLVDIWWHLLLKSLSSSSSVTARVAFGVFPLLAFWTKFFLLATRTLRGIANSLSTRILSGDLPSEVNLWMLRCKPDSVSGSYSSPLILRTFYNTSSTSGQGHQHVNPKLLRYPCLLKINNAEMFHVTESFPGRVFTFLLFFETLNFFLAVFVNLFATREHWASLFSLWDSSLSG